MNQTRIFKIGSQIIAADESLQNLSNEQVRDLLKATYPELAHATIQEQREGDTLTVHFKPQPGRKG